VTECIFQDLLITWI